MAYTKDEIKKLAISAKITGFVSGAGPVLPTDTILEAIQKLDGNNASIKYQTEKTKTEIDTLIASNGLIPGMTYKITGVHKFVVGDGISTFDRPALYDDGTGSGTTIFLKAATSSKLEVTGHGLFYNPKYSNSANNYSIWNESISYFVSDIVFWGGYAWQNVNGNTGESVDVLTLDAEWNKIAYNTLNYNISIDIINYDIINDLIIKREDLNGNVVQVDRKGWYNIMEIHSIMTHPIAAFMWGNSSDYYDAFLGVNGNRVFNSYLECINTYGGSVLNNSLTENSIIVNNVINSGSKIINNVLNNISSIKDNSLINYSIIGNNTLYFSEIIENSQDSGYIRENFIGSEGYISNNTIGRLSEISNNYIQTSSGINYNELINISDNGANISYNSLSSSSAIYQNVLNENSKLSYNSLSSGSDIQQNLLNTNSEILFNELQAYSLLSFINLPTNLYFSRNQMEISRISFNEQSISSSIKHCIFTGYDNANPTILPDISTATYIYAIYPRYFYLRPDFSPRIRFYNNSDVLEVHAITD